jgi:hypothetical protein
VPAAGRRSRDRVVLDEGREPAEADAERSATLGASQAGHASGRLVGAVTFDAKKLIGYRRQLAAEVVAA